MQDDGDTKDDVKVPEGEIGEKIIRLFKTEEKDTSEFPEHMRTIEPYTDFRLQTLLS